MESEGEHGSKFSGTYVEGNFSSSSPESGDSHLVAPSILAKGNAGPPKYRVVATDPCQRAGDVYDDRCRRQSETKCPARAAGQDPGQWIMYRQAPWGLADPAWDEMRIADAGLQCVYGAGVPDPLVQIAGMVARELQSREIAPAVFGVQPSPHTLRGAHTNFYALPVAQSFDLVLLGQQVRMVVYPVAVTYRYGDGTHRGPTGVTGTKLISSAWGAQTGTSHQYARTGDFTATVTTTYRGTYTINGGPAMPISGEANVTSPGITLSVWRTKVDWYANPNDTR